MSRRLLPRFKQDLLIYGPKAFEQRLTLLSDPGANELFYVPFDYVKTDARFCLVGITPGTTQIEISYKEAQNLIRLGKPDDEVLLGAKKAGGFGGPMRKNLLRMLKHFRIAEILGIADEADLWGNSNHLFYGTSVIPHAAFVKGKMFAGPFEKIFRVPAFQESFELDFVAAIRQINPDAVYVGLGSVPRAALLLCVERGVIRPNQYLGSLAHPSGSGGSQVPYFLGERSLAQLTPKDPVRRRVAWLDSAYREMADNSRRLLARL